MPTSFGAGFVYEEYAAGKAVNFLGPREILIKFPIQEVLSIKRLGFDVTGSATGPKDFELYYSLDEGDNYQAIELLNQFVNVAANSKSSFTYDLESLNLSGEEFWFKMVMKAGDRGTGSAYNESSGTLRIDNLHLIGSASTSNTSFDVNKLHYFFFHVDCPEISKQGIIEDVENPSLELPTEDYKVFFVWNSSDEELILPNTVSSANELYTATIFSNRQAEMYGYMGGFGSQWQHDI